MNDEKDKKDEKKVSAPHGANEARGHEKPRGKLIVSLILLGIGCLLGYHVLKKPSLDPGTTTEQQNVGGQEASPNAGISGGEPLEQRLKNPQKIAEGKEIYLLNCASCHGQLGEGGSGPNLADKFWIHGGFPDQIVSTVTAGVPSKGMVAWETTLGAAKIESVVAFVLSLQGTTPPQAKAPEGDEY